MNNFLNSFKKEKEELKKKSGKKRVTGKELAMYILYKKYTKVKNKKQVNKDNEK